MLENINIAVEAAVKAGKEIMKVYNSVNISVELKLDETPITLADKNAHSIISSILATTNLPILSEEGASIPYETRKNWERFWMIDPLDGTKEFIKRNGEFTVNIALIEKNQPILGVILVPATEVVYIGCSLGTFKANLSGISKIDNLLEIGEQLPLERDHSKYIVVESRSHGSNETDKYIETIDTEGKGIEIVSVGSSLKFCIVAEGLADHYPRLGTTMEWDTAAGQAIARYAGKTVVEYPNGKQLQYNKENLTNPWFVVK